MPSAVPRLCWLGVLAVAFGCLPAAAEPKKEPAPQGAGA